MITIASWANSYEHLKFGAGPNAVDCYGLIVKIYEEQYGIELPKAPGEDDKSRSLELQDNVYDDWVEIDRADLRIADVVGIIFEGAPTHCGIMVSKRHVLHSLRPVGVVCEPLKNYTDKIFGCFRNKKMAVNWIDI